MLTKIIKCMTQWNSNQAQTQVTNTVDVPSVKKVGSITPQTIRKSSYSKVDTTLLDNIIISSKVKEEEIVKKITGLHDNIKNISEMTDVDRADILSSQNSMQSIVNTLTIKSDMVKEYNKFCLALRDFSTTNPDLELLNIIEYQNAKNTTVVRFGINDRIAGDDAIAIQKMSSASFPSRPSSSANSTSSKSSKSPAKSKKSEKAPYIINPIESLLIKEAQKYCATNDRKTVLVSIFERDEDGLIRLGEDNALPSHTIMLHWDAAKKELAIVDPSNTEFSMHIVGNCGLIFDEESKIKILAPSKGLKIYTPQGNIGTGSKDYRDCRDIAVKLAFGIQESGHDFDIKKLLDHPVVQQIGTSSILEPATEFFHKHMPLRIRQATDVEHREAIAKKIGHIMRQSEIAEILDPSNNIAIDAFKAFESCQDNPYSQQRLDFDTIIQNGQSELAKLMGVAEQQVLES